MVEPEDEPVKVMLALTSPGFRVTEDALNDPTAVWLETIPTVVGLQTFCGDA